VPWVVSAVKSGAVSLILRDIVRLLQSLAFFWGWGCSERLLGAHREF
jgi:hypothetical protein